MGEISVKTGNNARNGGKNSLNRLIRCVCGKKIGPDPRNFNQRVSLGRNDLLIRTFPRFSEQKDHKSLFLALSSMSTLDWELKLVGKGPLIDFYKQYSVELGLDKKIEFLGERNDVEEILADSDIFLLISNWEGFPRSILEAMRASLPVIASDVGGASESVINGKTGYLIPRGDVIEIRKKLTELISDSQLREIMGNSGRKLYVENFTFNSMYKKTYSLYNDLAKKNKH
ncbi:glycosyltransferase [Citrobacter sp. RHBSTW-00570]|uniref:glycosyltransferase n=1 Tax=Citrobacter sp. RHBSTW-00570 TaxID=2742655 RepID=UPI002017BD54|nr:glycosyltransferase [Citrobacter sp. RHBSTW-00570]